MLALSGGLDSVVLAHLLSSQGYQFALAHCNFNLRGKESDADENFCKKLAGSLAVEIFCKSFNTAQYAKEHHTNIQLAARNLRYTWFEQIRQEENFDFVVTAHHANDSIETVLMNLLRGTGINGLKGIPEKNGPIRRPLLAFSREKILAYAQSNKISYREDQSNAEDKYDRNFIRHHVLPKLKELNPVLEETFLNNTKHFNEEAGIVNHYLEQRESDLILQTHDAVFISKKKLKQEPFTATVLNYLLSGYGFNATQQENILQHLEQNSTPGKLFHSPSHRLTIDRNDLVIKTNSLQSAAELKLQSLEELRQVEELRCTKLSVFEQPENGALLIEPQRLIFPLTYRAVKTGDKFKPFGMKGFKLLSDFMKEQKLNAFQKENCRVLVNGNGDIVWVAGYRSDERYKVDVNANNFLKIKAREF